MKNNEEYNYIFNNFKEFKDVVEIKENNTARNFWLLVTKEKAIFHINILIYNKSFQEFPKVKY